MIDLHIHSNFSDGKASVAEIAKKAKELGLKAIAIVDHSIELGFGLDEIKAKRREMEIEDAKAIYGIKIYSGIECGINHSGDIFLPMHDFDFIVASVHENAMNYCERIIKCIENNSVHVLGHLFSDMFEFSRDPKLEEKLIEALEAYGVALEINSTHKCPPDDFLIKCSERKIKVSIGSDAHRLESVGKVEWSEQKRKKYLSTAKLFNP
ncbi:MAG: PHP domain-containing protein [Archaeoglobaceae archaeon]